MWGGVVVCGIDGTHKAAMDTLNKSSMSAVPSGAWGTLIFDHVVLELTRNDRESSGASDRCLDYNN